MKNIHLIVPLLFSSSLSVHASTFTFDSLPGEIQSCLTTNTCFVDDTSNTDFGNVSFFNYYVFNSFGQLDLSGRKQLVRYDLTSPSINADGSALNGSVWMAADNSYNLSESQHTFTLYLDKVSPSPGALLADSHDHPLKKIISIDTTELLAGSGSYEFDYLNYSGSGGLKLHPIEGDAGYPYLSCIECSVSIDFNLAGLKYLNTGAYAVLAKDPLDTRAMLYSESIYVHEGGITGGFQQNFYVAAVPEPETWGMWMAGLGVLAVIKRRRKKGSAS